MNTPKSYQRLTPVQKINLIQRSLNGEKISVICKEIGISRTIFYKWLREYKKSAKSRKQNKEIIALTDKRVNATNHWKKIKKEKEQEIIKLWLNNPKYSVRKIAKETHVSTGGAWNVINKHKLIVSKSGSKKIKRYARKTYKKFDSNQKIEFIKMHENGMHLAKVARMAGVSRTIFYRWMKEYKNAKSPEEALVSHRPSGVDHWRYIPGIKEQVLNIVTKNPELSLSQIAYLVKQNKQKISRSGLYYILKKMNLTTYETRLAYVESSRSIARYRHYHYDLPRFAALGFVAIFGIFSLLYSLNRHLVPSFETDKITPIAKQETAYEPPSPTPELSTSKQDFKWGALAMNSPKSTYSKEDDVSIGFGVVDHQGTTVCDAELSLEVLDQSNGKIRSEKTGSGIEESGECSLSSVTNSPDYQANLGRLGKEGTYNLRVKSKTYDGEKEFEGKLIIDNTTAFEITRDPFPTRVFPESSYPVELSIKANEDFKGQITETLPDGITASKISSLGILFKNTSRNVRSIHWKVDFKKGNTYKFSYTLTFPLVYPEYYEIGPLRFVDSRTYKMVYQEPRYWQVVVDP